MPPLLPLLLALQAQATLGEPVTVDYPVPEGWSVDSLGPAEDLSVIGREGGAVTLVPLAMDTLELPVMTVSADTSVMELQPPPLVVARTMPDTSWTVPQLPAPLASRIPPGLPGDYVERHVFWADWRPAPGRHWLPYLVGVLLVAGLLLFVYARVSRRRRSGATTSEAPAARAAAGWEERAEALLDSAAFADGDWEELYRQVDLLLRAMVTARFGLDTRSLTWRQLDTALTLSGKEGARFSRETGELQREVLLQRYAGWGGSRERARRFVGRLARIGREWQPR